MKVTNRYSINLGWIGIVLMLPFLLSGCIREEKFDNTPQDNFEALWKIIDEKYCFLDYKQIDWNAIHDKYQPFITPNMSKEGDRKSVV